jgi:hypothetical protein
MTSGTPTPGMRRVPTVGSVLSSDPARLAVDLSAAFRDAALRGDLGGGVRRLARPALEYAVVQLGSAAERLTGIELGGILLDGWRSHRDIVAAADRTLRAPGVSETVGLTAHQVSAIYEPTIDLLFDERLAAVIRLAFGVELAVASLMASVQLGRLRAVRVGETEASVTLAAAGVELVRGSARIDLSRSFALGPGVVIRRDGERGR